MRLTLGVSFGILAATVSRLRALETELLRTLNAFVEPLARAGCGSPGVFPAGIVVLETTGRRSGRPHRTPVLATLVGGQLLVGTVRGERSEWMKNARANPRVRYWLCGRPREARALVFSGDGWPAEAEGLTPLMRGIASGLYRGAGAAGAAFAVLTPAAPGA